MSAEVIASITAAVITIVFGVLQKFFFMHLKSIKDNQQLLLEKIAEVISNQGKFVHLTKCDADMKSCQDCLEKVKEDFNNLQLEFTALKTKIGFWHDVEK